MEAFKILDFEPEIDFFACTIKRQSPKSVAYRADPEAVAFNAFSFFPGRE